MHQAGEDIIAEGQQDLGERYNMNHAECLLFPKAVIQTPLT